MMESSSKKGRETLHQRLEKLNLYQHMSTGKAMRLIRLGLRAEEINSVK